MRFFEFTDTNIGLDKFITLLRNYRGRAASKKVQAKYNWASVEEMARKVGFEFAADYQTFKKIYDSTPEMQDLIKNFNDQGIELNVPGAPDEKNPSGTKDSEDEIAKIAASAAPQQLAKSQQAPQV